MAAEFTQGAPWVDEMAINRQPAPMDRSTFELDLQGEQTVAIHFKLFPQIILCGLEGRGKCAAAYGPLVYALDQPPRNVPLDSVVLNLGQGDFRTLFIIDRATGWPILRVPAYQIPVLAAFAPTYQSIGSIDLIPVLCTGLKANPGLTEYLDGESTPAYNQEKNPDRPVPWISRPAAVLLVSGIAGSTPL